MCTKERWQDVVAVPANKLELEQEKEWEKKWKQWKAPKNQNKKNLTLEN